MKYRSNDINLSVDNARNLLKLKFGIMKKAMIMLALLFAFSVASAQTDKTKTTEQQKTDSLARQQPPVNPTESYSSGHIPDTSQSNIRSGARKPKGVTGNQPNPPTEPTDKKSKTKK